MKPTRATLTAFAAILCACSADDERRLVSGDDTLEGDSSDSVKGPDEGCNDCTGVGGSLLELACALDICDDDVLLGNALASPTGDTSLEAAYEAVSRFGSPDNDLGPRSGGSYALLATGEIQASYEPTAPNHSDVLPDGGELGVSDPYAQAEAGAFIYDAVEWTLTLRAPDWAKGFAVDYAFFSAEYEEYVGSKYNDKFYMQLRASSAGDEPVVVNFTACRDPERYADFVCGVGSAPSAPNCEDGLSYCYIAINTALSECCWLEGCESGTATTDIDGTGFSCATAHTQECAALDDEEGTCDRLTVTSEADRTGGTTGWLSTSWPIAPGETFTLTFHLHDTADAIFDSAVLLDNFRFVESADAGTVVVK